MYAVRTYFQYMHIKDTKEIYTESSLRGTKCAKMSADFRFGRHVEGNKTWETNKSEYERDPLKSL